MKDNDVCDIQCINENSVRGVKSQMPQDETFQLISDHFKVLSDPTRVKILYALKQKEICVCDLAAVLEITDSAVSHQLRLLRDKDLVKFRKEGKRDRNEPGTEMVLAIERRLIKLLENFEKSFICLKGACCTYQYG